MSTAKRNPGVGAALAEQIWETAQQATRDHAQRIREREQLLARYGPELLDDLARALGQTWDALLADASHRELMREFAIAALQVFDHHRAKETPQNADKTLLDSPSPKLEQRDGGGVNGTVPPSDVPRQLTAGEIRALERTGRGELVQMVLADARNRNRRWLVGGPDRWSKDELVTYLVRAAQGDENR